MLNRSDVDRRRAQADKYSRLGKRTGYISFLVASVAFALALLTGFRFYTGTIMALGLIVACAIMPFAVVVSYGIKAALRDDHRLLVARNTVVATTIEPPTEQAS